MEDRRNVGENSCNSGEGTDKIGPILDVYYYDDDDDDDGDAVYSIILSFSVQIVLLFFTNHALKFK